MVSVALACKKVVMPFELVLIVLSFGCMLPACLPRYHMFNSCYYRKVQQKLWDRHKLTATLGLINYTVKMHRL